MARMPWRRCILHGNMVPHGTARHGWHGLVWHSTARRGMARDGAERLGVARSGTALQDCHKNRPVGLIWVCGLI